MTYKKIVVYYSANGNTKALVDVFPDEFEKVEVKNVESLNEYDEIVFATSTWGRGTPPRHFLNIKNKILNLSGKKIGLLGSGDSHFEYFCGALDVLEDMTKNNNSIIYKFKFEGYPTKKVFEDFTNILKEVYY